MNSNVNYRKKIKQGLENGMINYDKTTVTFNDGHVIGGVLANTQEELINIIEKCLYRKDFSIPECLQ